MMQKMSPSPVDAPKAPPADSLPPSSLPSSAERDRLSIEPPRFIPGSVIDGVYRVIGQLGSGAMGVVFLAHDSTLDRLVAIKLVHDDLCEEAIRRRFIAEARAMARVKHPNVLQIFSFGEDGGAPYFVMELVDGPTLADWMAQNSGPPALDVAIKILEGVCDGVSAIHAADTLHRDLKPSNILLDANLRPRVADLGLALLYREDGTNKPELVGTPAYMAPEVAFALAVEPTLQKCADVYALGCVAYELFTGRPPFLSESNTALLLQHATEEVPDPRNLRPELPEGVASVVLRALVKDPAQRIASVEQFKHDLLTAYHGESEPARILVAEDSDDFRDALEVALTHEFPHATIECTADGQAALEAFEAVRPSVAIIDLRMPRVDGLQLTRLFRARDPLATVPIIVLTASGGPDEWKELASYGADRFLVKPVVLEDVVSMVRRCLAERGGAAGARRTLG
jgi:serine/threonine-protein kinase